MYLYRVTAAAAQVSATDKAVTTVKRQFTMISNPRIGRLDFIITPWSVEDAAHLRARLPLRRTALEAASFNLIFYFQEVAKC